MEMVEVRNGATNPRRRKRRRNPVKRTATKTANPKRKRRRRNPVATTRTRSASAVANPKRKRRRRNPVVAVKRKRNGSKRRNGIFGDSKADVKNVLTIVGGMIGTKIAGGIVSPYAGQILAYVGASKYARPITNGVLAVTVVPMVAGMLKQDAKMARLGGLAVAALDVIEMLLPSGFAYNPFAGGNNSPIVLSGETAALVGAATADVANAAISAANNATAKLAGMPSRSRFAGGSMDHWAGAGELNEEF